MAWAAVVAAVVGAAAAVLTRWHLARLAGRWAAITAASLLLAGLLVLALLLAAPGVASSLFPETRDPAVKARFVTETISKLINCSVLAVPAGIIGGLTWLVSVRRLRQSDG